MLEVAQRAKPKESFSKEQLNKLDELYDIAMQIASIAKASIQSINQQQPVNDSLIFDIVDLDEKMVKEKLNIRKSLNNEKRLINLDAYARIVNELEQIGEQFASICLAYGEGIKEEKDEETVNEV